MDGYTNIKQNNRKLAIIGELPSETEQWKHLRMHVMSVSNIQNMHPQLELSNVCKTIEASRKENLL